VDALVRRRTAEGSAAAAASLASLAAVIASLPDMDVPPVGRGCSRCPES